MIGPSFRKNDDAEKLSAAEYSSGGRTTPRMMSVSSSSRGIPGMNDAASATTPEDPTSRLAAPDGRQPASRAGAR
jgi:hypothetical protein